MRFVPVKEEEQQAALMLHRVRDLLVRQRTQLINAIRAHLAEFGMVEAKGPWNLRRLLATVEEETGLLEAVGGMVRLMAAQLEEARGTCRHDLYPAGTGPASTRRLGTIPGVGPLTATTIAAMVPDPSAFKAAENSPPQSRCHGDPSGQPPGWGGPMARRQYLAAFS
jgi:transposase